MKIISIFTVMPFAEKFESIFNFGILPINNKFPGWSLQISRADTVQPRDSILWNNIRELISNSDIVIIDLTGHNPNVMMELGFASAISKDLILISQEKPSEPNVSGHIYIEYKLSNLDLLQSHLITRISGILDSVLKARSVMRVGFSGKGRSTWKSPPPLHRKNLLKEATEQRDLGFVARERGELKDAIEHFKKALEIENNYWEVFYDIAFCYSYIKEEDKALENSSKAINLSLVNKDYTTAWKSHNLRSGIYKRRGDFALALEEIHSAYDFSHLEKSLENGAAHIVPIKNRIVLEFLHGDRNNFKRLSTELRNHPDVQSVVPEIEKEIGKF